MKKEITVPSSASEIPMHRYQEFAKLDEKGMTDFFKLFSTLAGCNEDEAKLVRAKDVGRAVGALVEALNDTKHPLVYFHSYNGIKYGFEPQLDELTFGTMADISTAFETPETWHKALAILYRPISRKTENMGGMYAIEPHRADSEAYRQRQELFKEAPSSLFIGVRSFFLTGSMALERYTRASLTRLPEKLHPKTGQKAN